METKKLVIEKSRTISLKNREYKKVNYIVEAELNDTDNLQKVRDGLEMILNAWLKELENET